jgi:DNA-binding MarR family transcriptional regulator
MNLSPSSPNAMSLAYSWYGKSGDQRMPDISDKLDYSIPSLTMLVSSLTNMNFWNSREQLKRLTNFRSLRVKVAIEWIC